jgi:hypothetical protein
MLIVSYFKISRNMDREQLIKNVRDKILELKHGALDQDSKAVVNFIEGNLMYKFSKTKFRLFVDCLEKDPTEYDYNFHLAVESDDKQSDPIYETDDETEKVVNSSGFTFDEMETIANKVEPPHKNTGR